MVTVSDDNNNYDDDEEYENGRNEDDQLGLESKLDERELAMLRSNNVSGWCFGGRGSVVVVVMW